MNKMLSTSRLKPPRIDPAIETARRVVSFTPTDPNAALELIRPLTDLERERLASRVAMLEQTLAERDPGSLRRSLVGMMLATPSMRQSAEDLEAVVAACSAVLGGLPPWAVEAAIARFIRGRVAGHDPKWAPAAAELHAEADRIVAPYRADLQDCRRLLAGRAPAQDERISSEAFDELARQLRAGSKAGPISEPSPAAQASMARDALRARLAELGQDPGELDKIPNAPPRGDDFRRVRR